MNKKNVNYLYYKSQEIKKDFFEGKSILEIAKKYTYDYQLMEKFLSGSSTKNYTDEKWRKWRRCSVCKVYRDAHDDYYVHGNFLLCRCKNCSKLMARNWAIKERARGKNGQRKKRKIKYYIKNYWRIRVKIKVKKILGYYDSKWRITKKRRV